MDQLHLKLYLSALVKAVLRLCSLGEAVPVIVRSYPVEALELEGPFPGLGHAPSHSLFTSSAIRYG